MTDRERFALAVRDLRTGWGLSHQELADMLGYSKSSVRCWQDPSRHWPRVPAIVAICRLFEIPYDELMPNLERLL